MVLSTRTSWKPSVVLPPVVIEGTSDFIAGVGFSWDARSPVRVVGCPGTTGDVVNVARNDLRSPVFSDALAKADCAAVRCAPPLSPSDAFGLPASARHPVRDTVRASPAAAPATYRLARAVIGVSSKLKPRLRRRPVLFCSVGSAFAVLGSYLYESPSNGESRDISHGTLRFLEKCLVS